MWFKIVGRIKQIEPIAMGRSVREAARLRKCYGGARWRKLKGIGVVELPDGSQLPAEVHWYEAHGVGRRKMKVKRVLD